MRGSYKKVTLLKVINNSLNLSKSNRDRDGDRDGVTVTVTGYLKFLRFISIEEIQAVYQHIFKHHEVRQKLCALDRIFNSLFSVWKCDETPSFVFRICEIVLKEY